VISRQWQVAQYDPHDIKVMAEALNLSPLTIAVLLGRGVREIKQARQWLFDSQAIGYDPFLMPDMERAVQRLQQAVQSGERICCYGDYDVDGITAASLYLLFLRGVGANVGFYIPERQNEGYGLNESAVRTLAQEGVKVLVTVDCGTTSHEEVRLARSLGIDVIVTDHHQLQGAGPPVLGFLNPHRTDCEYPFKDLCSAGLAFKVVTAYVSLFGPSNLELGSFTDLVALATLADMVPLRDENRLLVRQGLDQISKSSRYGIRALRQRVGGDKECTEGEVAFQLAPMINAAGRLNHGKLGVDLLTSSSMEYANRLAEHLGNLNRQRRQIEGAIFHESLRMVDRTGAQDAVVVGKRQWHVGVVGIVASRLVERFQKPAVVIAFDEHGFGRGSVRSVPGLDVCRVLEKCSDLLDGFGGHPAAAGLKIWEENFPPFQERFSSLVAHERRDKASSTVLDVDAQVSLGQLNHQLLRELAQLQPFGVGNPEPTFMAVGLRVLEQRIVGDDHLKLIVRQNHSVPFDTIGFRMGSWDGVKSLQSRPIDLAFVPERNRWKGLDRIQLRIRDVKVSEGLRGLEC
jgi:single-stranded-DNA-specific exonuclease